MKLPILVQFDGFGYAVADVDFCVEKEIVQCTIVVSTLWAEEMVAATT